MKLRTFHRTVGMIFAPFFIFTALAGSAVALHDVIGYSEETKHTLVHLHNWTIVWHYAALVLTAALITMAVTGFCIAMQVRKAKAKARSM